MTIRRFPGNVEAASGVVGELWWLVGSGLASALALFGEVKKILKAILCNHIYQIF